MKYDTSPLSIDTLDVESARSEDPLRFVLADDDIHQTNVNLEDDSGPISQATVLSGSVGFDTFIENRHKTDSLKSFSVEPPGAKYRSFVLAGVLAVVSAFAGGFAVYFFSATADQGIVQKQTPAANTSVNEVGPSETFVVKQTSERAAEEPLVPHVPDGSRNPDRPVQLARTPEETPVVVEASPDQTAASSAVEQPVTNTEAAPTAGDPAPPQKLPEKEAKVGAYVVEKPASGRKPLARCADGTYSFSASKAAACSGRGGVSEWMADGKAASNTPAKQAAYVLGPRGGCYYLDSSNKKVYVEKKFCQ